MTLDLGTPYQAKLAVANAAGQPINPLTAQVTVTLPDQTTTPLNVTLPPATTGLLISDVFVSTQPGLHKFTWATTSPSIPKADFENFRSYSSAISLDYARDRLGRTSPARDEQIRHLCGVATREVEKVVGVLVPRTFTDELVPGSEAFVLRVQHGPIFSRSSVTSLKSAYPGGPSWNTADANLDDAGQLIVMLRPGTIRLAGQLPFWYGPWLISYKAGWNGEIPEPIIEAIGEVLFDLWSQFRGLSADLAESAELQSIVVPPYYRLPPRALAAVKSYELPGFG